MTDYGRDISCTDGIRTGRYSSGTRLVAEALYRRFTTRRGSLRGGEDEQNYGLDLSNLIGKASTPAEIAALPGRIQNEALKDPRVETIDVDVQTSANGPSVAGSITVSGTTADGPFSLVVGVDEISVSLLGIS